MKTTPRKVHKRFKDWTGFFFLKVTIILIGHLPPSIGRWLGGIVGAVGWLFWRGYRRLAHTNVRIALGGELFPRQERSLVFRSAQNMVREFFEISRWLTLSSTQRRELIDLSGREHLEKARRGGKGAIMITAHLSNFPLISVALTLSGYPNAFVMQPIKVKQTDTYFAKLGRRLGVEIIDAWPRDRCALECIRNLNQGKIIIMALDLDARREGVFVNFFGKPASTYTGPLVLAQRTGAVILPAFVIRQADGRYQGFIHPPLLPAAGEEYTPILDSYNRILEDYIRRYPWQWSWIGKRWRTRPPGEEASLYRKGY